MTAEVARIPVRGTAPYDVVVGRGLAAEAAGLLTAADCVAVVATDGLQQLAAPYAAALRHSGKRVVELTVPAGETAKRLETVARLWDELGRARVSRSDAVLAVGGGAATDAVGFAAATWLRGVSVVHVPTTLLGMVDAAVGGKTAINTASGKNLVGAFHPPAGVFVDLGVLDTLPRDQWVNGMAEVVKAGFIADPEILDVIEADPAAAASPTGAPARQLIERSIRVKAEVVSDDLRETGRREHLNYGHTLAHAIERVEDYSRPHGHAVSIGLVFAAALGRLSGRLEAAVAVRHRAVLERLSLPTSYDGPGAWSELRDAMGSDKKVRGDRLRFVVLDGLARPGILEQPEPELLDSAFAEVMA